MYRINFPHASDIGVSTLVIHYATHTKPTLSVSQTHKCMSYDRNATNNTFPAEIKVSPFYVETLEYLLTVQLIKASAILLIKSH